MKSRKLAAVSLGCAKNRIDTEEVLGYLASLGYIITDDYHIADIIIVNTCSFIDKAQQESVNTLIQIAAERKNSNTKIIAAGCLVETFGTDITTMIPEIDGAIGVHSYNALEKFINMVYKNNRPVIRKNPSFQYQSLSPRILTTPVHSVNVKIAEGCSNICHYCLIPNIRGSYRSRDPHEIIREIENLLKNGAKEINLIAQDTTSYGSDNTEYPDLINLIKMILSLDQFFWLRIMYTYPDKIKDGLLEVIASDKRVCNYLDIPIQHVNDKILRLMNRSYDKKYLQELLKKITNNIPEAALRTTCMVGYPGEKYKDFRELLNFIGEGYFRHMGAFTFSGQEGTFAANFADQVPRRIANKRFRTLMLRQQFVSKQKKLAQLNKETTMLVEKVLNRGHNLYYGRTEHQAPEVDGGVYIRSSQPLQSGNWVKAGIFAASPYHFVAINPCLIKEPQS